MQKLDKMHALVLKDLLCETKYHIWSYRKIFKINEGGNYGVS